MEPPYTKAVYLHYSRGYTVEEGSCLHALLCGFPGAADLAMCVLQDAGLDELVV